MLTSTRYVHNLSDKLTSTERRNEWWNCRNNPFHFIFNYVHIPEIGGVLKYDKSIMHSKMKQTVRSIYRYHKCILMASRQLGKSTISACLLEWACNFYPRMPATILNASKTFGLENLEKVKFVHSQLPGFLRSPLKYRGERKTTIDYANDSILRVFYPSSTTSPSSLARSLTSPILYIDEGAHIPHMRLAYGAAQPTLSRAREQAKKHGYPYFILVTSTPNGTVGTGEWFWQMWDKAVDGENIFDETDYPIDNADEYVDDLTRNGFVRIRFHWSEDPQKDDKWYTEQTRDLNFDTRLINQELNLVFVGSTNCIFPDEYLEKLKAKPVVDRIKLPYGTHLKLYTHRRDFDKTDYFILSCDTAKSLAGDFNALQLFSFANFCQIGEYYGRLGSVTKYGEVLMKLIDELLPIVNNRLIIAIENNNIGGPLIENLENATNFDYMQYVYSPEPDKYVGINTNNKTKPLMVSFLYDYIIDEPQNLKSQDLINQLNIIERKINGSISAQSGYHDDLFMASALAAYARRLSELEISPMLGISTILHQRRQANQISGAIAASQNVGKIGNGIGIKYNKEEGGIEYIISDEDSGESFSEDAPVVFV